MKPPPYVCALSRVRTPQPHSGPCHGSFHAFVGSLRRASSCRTCVSVENCRLALEEGPEAAGGMRTVLWKCSRQWEGMDEPLALHPALQHQAASVLSPASPSAQPKEQQAVEEDAGGAEDVPSQSEAASERSHIRRFSEVKRPRPSQRVTHCRDGRIAH